MKTCPFCREEIHDEAIKCRYCASSLLSSQPNPEKPADNATLDTAGITYVVDKGLIQFAKFVVASLAIFITAGATLYGFNIKESADKVRELAEKVRDAQDKTNDKLRDAQDKMQKAQETIAQQVKSVQSTADDINRTVDVIHEAAKAVAGDQKQIAEDRKLIADLLAQAQKDAQQTHVVASRSQEQNQSPTNIGDVRQLMKLYDFPSELRGKGQVIGLIELGGGFQDSDLKTFFAGLGLAKPQVTAVSVLGRKNQPGGGDGSDFQVALDIETTGAVAPAAHLVVYFAPNTNAGFVEAVRTAVFDDVNRPSVIAISWGSSESEWTPASMTALNDSLAAAAVRKITVVAPAGDSGASNGAADGKPNAVFPASSPYVLAVGGTTLTASGNTIISEVVWNNGVSASGGGVSNFFPAPTYQKQISLPRAGRGFPDVAAQADPSKGGYELLVQGRKSVVGGTGAASALWAGLIALINEGVGENVGFINPLLYEQIGPSDAFRKITAGNNSLKGVEGYSAGPGWSPVAGWGSPNGRKLLAAFRSKPGGR